MESLLGGVRHHGLLAVQLLLGQIVHHFPHARLAPHTDAAEALALAVGSVLVELHFQEVSHPEALDIVLDVLVCGPPGQVPDVQLPLLVETARPAAGAPGNLRLLLLGCGDGGLLLLLVAAGRYDIVVQIIVLPGEILLGEILLDIRVKININTVRHGGSENEIFISLSTGVTHGLSSDCGKYHVIQITSTN